MKKACSVFLAFLLFGGTGRSGGWGAVFAEGSPRQTGASEAEGIASSGYSPPGALSDLDFEAEGIASSGYSPPRKSGQTYEHSLLFPKTRRGETEMNQALAAGDIEGFRKALVKGLEKPAAEFFEDWWTVTEKEGNTVFHQLALADAPFDGSLAPAAQLRELARAFSFPKKKRVKRIIKVKIGGLHLFKPLEKTGLGRAIINGEDKKEFYGIVRDLLSGPAEDLLAILHASTWSRKTLRGLIKESEAAHYKESAIYSMTLDSLESLFVRPLLETNGAGLTPLAAVRAKGGDSYYVLREALGDFKREADTALLIIAAAMGVLGAEAFTIFSPESQILSRLAADWGMSASALAAAAACAPFAAAGAGIGCCHAFKARRQKQAIQRLKSL